MAELPYQGEGLIQPSSLLPAFLLALALPDTLKTSVQPFTKAKLGQIDVEALKSIAETGSGSRAELEAAAK